MTRAAKAPKLDAEDRSPLAESRLAGLFDERTDLSGRSKDNRSAISLHSSPDDNGLTWKRSVLARIGLETQVELPDLARPAVRGFHRVGVAAVADGNDLTGRRRFFQVDLPRLHHHAGAARRSELSLRRPPVDKR